MTTYRETFKKIALGKETYSVRMNDKYLVEILDFNGEYANIPVQDYLSMSLPMVVREYINSSITKSMIDSRDLWKINLKQDRKLPKQSSLRLALQLALDNNNK